MNARLMGRAAAGVGALVAAGAVTLLVVGGTASAAGTGRCTDNVNVREKPDVTSKIVAVCERGEAVQVGKTRNGFVQLTNLDGWAAQAYVSVDGRAPAAAASTTRTTAAAATQRSHHADDAAGPEAESTASPTNEADPADDTSPTTQPRPRGTFSQLFS
jgi:Bacterial SH3 domain